MQALPDALAESDSVETIGFDLDATLAEKWKAEWLDGVPEMLQRLAEQGQHVVVATNQGGVACGAAGWGDQYPSPANIVQRFETLEADLPEGVDVEWRVSIYYPDALEKNALQNVAQRIETLGKQAGLEIHCYPEEAARKPGAAMLQGCGVFVGDRDSDVEAAREAGVPGLQISDLESTPAKAVSLPPSSPGGFYSALPPEQVPQRVYHGTGEANVEAIQKNGLFPHPRGQGNKPLVSTTPHADTALGWGGGQCVVEVDTDKLEVDRVWTAPTFDEIAFEQPIPVNAIRRIWRAEWVLSDQVNEGWIPLRSDPSGYTRVLKPL
jgi:hypothetical protein